MRSAAWEDFTPFQFAKMPTEEGMNIARRKGTASCPKDIMVFDGLRNALAPELWFHKVEEAKAVAFSQLTKSGWRR